MKILTAMVASGTGIFKCDAIEKDGFFWLVPRWIGPINEPKQKPVRLVRVPKAHVQFHPGSQFGDMTITRPIPIDFLEGRCQPSAESGYVVVENAEI